MQVQEEAYFNFVNSNNSDATRRNYEYCMSRFLEYCNLDLNSFLRSQQQEMSGLIIKYLVSLKNIKSIQDRYNGFDKARLRNE